MDELPFSRPLRKLKQTVEVRLTLGEVSATTLEMWPAAASGGTVVTPKQLREWQFHRCNAAR